MGRILFAIIRLQFITIAVLSCMAWMFGGKQIFWSMLLGGFCYIVPTALAVSVLSFLKKQPALAGAGFLIAEGLKTVLALFLMIAVFVFYRDIKFIPFFIGLLSVSHFVFLLFLRVYHHGR